MSVSSATRPAGRVVESTSTAVVTIWVTSAVASVLAPDLVSGSEHEHLPIALITVWVWAGLATAYAMMTPQRGSRASWTIAVAGVWISTLLVMVLAPVMVTGTDPTEIPLAVLVAPPVAAAVTGLLSLRQANLPQP